MATKTNTTINGKDYYRLRRKIDGKVKSFYGTSKSDAERKYSAFLEKRAEEMHREAQILDVSTFSDRAEEFINEALKPSAKYAEGTIDRYSSAYYTHVAGSPLSKLVASKIKAADIQKFYNRLDVSQQTLRQVHKFMSAFYKWLARNEYASDVLSAVEIPKKHDNSKNEDIVIWAEDEIKTITENIAGYRYRFFIMLMLYTGMRFSEVLGLKYEDIKDDVIHVKRQCYQGEIKPPKANSVRDIPMHKVLKKELKIHEKWHRAEMKKNHYKTDFLFTTNTGAHVNRSSLDKSIKRFYARIGVSPKHNHAYRSTFCTQLCKCGVPLEVASKLLGHKNIAVTARHYALVQPQSQKEAIAKLKYSG